MIVYFREKSKIFKIGFLGGVFGIVLYMIWLWTSLLNTDVQTLQLVRTKVTNQVQTTSRLENEEKVPKSQYLYVASSRGKYFYPKDCSRARSLSVKNMLHFKDKMSALGQGYTEYIGC